jgi:hypothetical protein
MNENDIRRIIREELARALDLRGVDQRAFDYKTAAKYSGISPELLKLEVRAGNVPVHYWNSKPLFFREELDEILDQLPAERQT